MNEFNNNLRNMSIKGFVIDTIDNKYGIHITDKRTLNH